MNFLTVILRGLMRRPVRTGLTLVGIAIGIAAVVTLVGISGGFEKSWQSGMQARGTDIVISNMGSALAPKPFEAAARDRVAALPEVAAAAALLVDLMGIENAQMMLVSAREWEGFTWGNLRLVQGRMLADPQERAVLLGTTAAEVLKKKPGDTLQVDTEELSVAGIVDGGAWVENGSVIMALPLFQKITGNEGRINVIDVRVKPGLTQEQLDALRRQMDALVPGTKAVAASAHIRQSQSYKVVQAISWGTSLLAVLVGVLGVMNTMLMTMFERKQEIAVLLALGWTRGRIITMVLWESALLGMLGGLVGVALGIVGVKLLETAPAIRGLLEPDLNAGLLIASVGIAVGVGMLSGLYPAWRSSRLTPSLALQN